MWEIINRNSKNLVSMLQEKSKSSPKKTAYLFLEDGEGETNRLTYSELHNKARTIAAYLQNKQAANQRILLLYPAGVDFIAAFMGCLYIGAVAVPISCPDSTDFQESVDKLVAVANDASISGVLTIQSMVPLIKEYLIPLLGSNNIFVEETSDLAIDCAEEFELPKIDDDAIAYLQYTSGSISTPKGVVISHRNLNNTLKYTAKRWCYSKKSVTLTWTSHFHAFGLVCGLLVPLYYGTPCIIIPPTAFIRRPFCWLKAISKYRVSHSGGPNFAYERCIQDINIKELVNIDLSCWQVAVSAGEVVRHQTLLEFSRKFSNYGFSFDRFCSVYGMSETGVIASTKYRKKPKFFSIDVEEFKNNQIVERKFEEDVKKQVIVSCGKPLENCNLLIVNPNTMLPIEEGTIGEIWLASPAVGEGYWRRSSETEKTFRINIANRKESYFRSGDLGFIKNKELFVTGRLKDVIIIYGKNYYPLDFEIIAKNTNEKLRGVLNVAFSLDILGKEEALIVQEIPDKITSLGEYDTIIKTIRLAVIQKKGVSLYSIVLVKKGSIPKTASGKIQRNLCRQWYLEKKLEIIREYCKDRSGNFVPKTKTLLPIKSISMNNNESLIN